MTSPLPPSRRALVVVLALLVLALAAAAPSAAQAQASACPCSLFTSADAPAGDAVFDQPAELGVKVRSDVDGYITKLKIFRQPGNIGPRTGHLWTSAGQLLASVEFPDTPGPVWQEAALPIPVAVTAGTTYVASYYASTGRFAMSLGGLSGGLDRAPLHAPAGESVGGNGVYKYGDSGFPTETWSSTNYWVDVVFETGAPADTRPPGLASVTPRDGASGVPATTKVTAVFDEPVDPQTVNSGSFALSDAAGNVVVSAVAYDADTRTATLTPSAPLALSKSYVATIKGGNAGPADASGNRFPADRSWTFSTPRQCPCTVFGETEKPPTDSAVRDQPLEVGMKFRTTEDGYITRLRFYKQANNAGTHVAHLWSGTGQLLASAPYRNETAVGWQSVELPNPVPVTKDTLYVASYYSSGGYYPFDPGYFNTTLDRTPMVAPAAGTVGGNGVYHYGASAFPNTTFNGTNYWVDAAFERTVPPDTRGPSVTETSPESGGTDIDRSASVLADFDEPLDPASVTAANAGLRDAAGTAVAATVSYNAQLRRISIKPSAPLTYGGTYTARLRGGTGGVSDVSGNPIATDFTWTFRVASQPPSEGPGGPILLVTSPSDPFGTYYAEILRGEGLNAFETTSGQVTADKLTGRSLVLLASPTVTDAEVSLLTNWVSSGGNLLAMRPDKKLAPLLGLTDAGATLANGYLKVDTTTAPGAGIDGQTLQFHGTADRYTLAGGSRSLATLYSGAVTATANPAVTMRDIGTSGGQAAAFTYDLARSVVYTRQGNPAWAGQKRDGTDAHIPGVRAVDLFYGPKTGDVQPNWVDMHKIDVPQADEQQRLLANLITELNLDKAPLPRFWYLPRGEKAAVVLTGDDHSVGGVTPFFNRLKAMSPDNCSVVDWECVRGSAYIYTDTPLTNADANRFNDDGFELGIHLNTGCRNFTAEELKTQLSSQLAAFATNWPSLPKPESNRTHCIIISDWSTSAKGQRAQGIRFDTNWYYNGPAGWLTKPGLLTGAGFPQRFADLDGSMIDVYQAMTQVSDESDISNPAQLRTLLNNALGSKAYYGVFTLNTHTDHGDHNNANDQVADAQARGVPIVSSKQMLDWVDGRNASSFGGIAQSGNTLSFTVSADAKARGLEGMLPARSASGPLTRLRRNGQPVSWEPRTVKGVDYMVFRASGGSYSATYAADTTAPDITGVTAVADAEGHATVRWTTDEPSTSVVEYGRTTALGYEESTTERVTDHRVELTGLAPGSTYQVRVRSTDTAGNAAASPAPNVTFATPAGAVVDSRSDEFTAGTRSNTHAGGTLDGRDGEIQLRPAVAEEFETAATTSAWALRPWNNGGFTTISGGSLVADGSSTYTDTSFAAPRVLEFTATFTAVTDQAVGFSNDFSDYPYAGFSTGHAGEPIRLYASTGAGPTAEQVTPLPAISLSRPHRFRIEWSPTGATYYVDGVLVATHTVAIPNMMRPVISDYRLFGAGVRVHWLRMNTYPGNGTFTSRVLDSGPYASQWLKVAASADLPAGAGITYRTRTGSTAIPNSSWSAYANVAADGTIASPPGRYIQYEARLTRSTAATPTLRRVALTYGAGANRAPVPGTVAITPAAPRTNQTVTATPTGFTDPDGDALSYQYQWRRNGTVIAGATGASLNLNQAGNGDRGDSIRVAVTATDGKGGGSDPAATSVTVANTAPTAGTASIEPATPSTNDVLTAVATGFADIDGDELTYRYQWLRNGTAIAGATNRTLDLAVAGNGDANDRIDVDIRAADTSGALSPAARATKTITGTNGTPVPGTVSLAPASPKTLQTVTATPSGFRDPDGDPMTYRYQWSRNGTVIAGATSATLDLAVAGNGDRGDALTVAVSAVDSKGAVGLPATGRATVANSDPTSGSVTVKPTAPATNDRLTAATSGFADDDGDAVSYQYQWSRNGTVLTEETGRSIDLSLPGNGDLGDTLEVEVLALDGNGGVSGAVRASQRITAEISSAVASYGFEEASGSIAVDETGGHDGTVSGATRTDTGRFGRALSFDGTDDVVKVAEDPALRLTTGMTLQAWVKPDAATYWRTVIFKESGGVGYSLYANGETDVPSLHGGLPAGETIVKGTEELDPSAWTHLAGTYDGQIMRLYVNGTQVASKAGSGDLSPGTGPLTFGANEIWGEHFEGLIDEIRIYNRQLTAEEIRDDMARPVVAGTPQPPSSLEPQQIGAFAKPQAWPMVPVHLSLTSDGKVAAWDGFEAAVNSERRWDPETGLFDGIATGRNLFCAGHITLTDGRLLVAGGHIQAYEGTKDTNIYNPQTRTWTRAQDMAYARWYPTVTGMPDGRVFTVSGDSPVLNRPGQPVPLTIASNTIPEIYDPAANTWTSVPEAQRWMPLYPFMFVLPNGKLFDAGPDTTTRTFDVATKQWAVMGTSQIDGHSAVMYRPGKIMKSGTWSEPDFPGRTVTNRAVAIDTTEAAPQWREVAPMKYARSYHTLTMLPDGTVLSSGGQRGTDGVDPKTGILAAEIWDPGTNKWTTVASSRRPRLYHSSSLLLPDGRVLLAGGGAFGNSPNEKSGELYSPPYLFKGPRPQVTSGPDAVHYNQGFTLETPDASRIVSANMVRMGSVTHNLDMDQRYIPLTMQTQTGAIRLTGPANANVAPPGWYMVHLVDDKGVPSVAKIVRVDGAADTQAPSAPTSLAAAARTDGAQLTWTAATDNDAVAEYRVHRGTTAGFTPTTATRVGTVKGATSHRDSGVKAGTYHYKVQAVDRAGNVGAVSNTASVTVAGDTTAPTVSVTAPAASASVTGSVAVTAGATDAVGIQSVQFRLDGQDLGSADTTSPYTLNWDTTKTLDGRHTLTAVARDATGNATTSAPVAVTVRNTGLVAAYGFDEPTGSVATDPVSGLNGQITGATRTMSGRYGGALAFDGIDDWVTVPSDPSLNLGAGMTVEAWVRPSLLSDWRSVVMKEHTGALAYALYAHTGANSPAAQILTSAQAQAAAPAPLVAGTWTHLAMTWDGSTLRLFVDGAEVATQAAPGTLVTGTGSLRIGGNSVRGEWFRGDIDEVRIYNRPLSSSQIAGDMSVALKP